MIILNRLRKFGQEYCDLPTILSNISTLLRLLTVNIDYKYRKGISIYSYIITTVTAFCYFYTFLFSMVWFVFRRCIATGDIVAATVVFSIGITTEIGNLKLMYMAVHIEKIKKIVADSLACDSQIIPGSRFHINLLKALKAVKKRAIMYWMVLIGNGIMYLLKPLSIPGRDLPSNILIIYGLEPMLESPNYEIGWLLTIGCIFFVCYVSASVSTFLTVIVGYIESQLLALSEEILQIWPNAFNEAIEEIGLEKVDQLDTDDKIIINKHVANHLKKLIAHHALIISLFRQTEHLFRGAIALGYILLILGLLAALLGKLENTFIQLPFILILITMDCFIGQRVMDACVVFERSVYDCQWENFDSANRKMVQVMLQNSQKSMTLSAGGIATLSFTCLLSIIRGIYSAYTALRSAVY